jgi:Ca-activated chloride channel homolog
MVELEPQDHGMNVPVSFHNLWPLAVLLAVPFFWWTAGRTRTSLGRRHLRVVAVLRTLALVFAVLALMRPLWNRGSSDISVVYALDVSRSVSSAFIDSALKWIEDADRRGKPAQARYLAFADHAVMLDKPGDVRTLAVTEGRPGTPGLDQAATNLESALDRALLGLDRNRVKRVVLLTDGNQTQGEVWHVLPRLKEAGVRVYPVPATVRGSDDVWLDGIDAPERVHAGEPMTVAVRAFAPHETQARVLLREGGVVLGNRALRLSAGINRVPFEVRMMRPGAAELAAEIFADGDPIPENNRARQSVWVGARTRVLYVEGHPESAHYLRDALTSQGIETVVVPPTDVPGHVAGLAPYDALILSDTPARALSAEGMQAIESWVRDEGGGLLFLGGENVFGEQGYSASPVEKVLPVEFKAQEKRKDLALVVALDRSYSMKGRKMELAKEATRAALDLLEEQHQIAVVTFDSQPYISVPMQYVRSRRKAEDLISRIQASGQTNIYPALGIVFRLLQKTTAKAKHVILLSDGDTHPADFESLLKRMTNEKIVVSTVAVGEGADLALMRDIAKWGKGKAYATVSPEAIPQIFIEETQRAVRSNLLEDSFKPVVKRASRTLQGIDVGRMPELKGFVSTKARDNAEVLLATPSGSPLLARWQYGLGRTVMFSSDAKNRWASNWLDWPGYGKLWAQLVRETMRRESGEQLAFQVVRDGATALVTLSALSGDGRFRNDLAPIVSVTGTNGVAAKITLQQSGAGRYQARVPIENTARPVGFELVASPGITAADARRAGIRRLHYLFADEYRSLPPDIGLLEALAQETGGKVGADIDEIFARHGDESRVSRPLWPWLVLLALLAYLLEIAVRRTPVFWRWLES